MLTKEERITCKKKIKRYTALRNISACVAVLIAMFLCGIVDYGKNGAIGIIIMTASLVSFAMVAYVSNNVASQNTKKIHIDNLSRKRDMR